MTLGEKLSKLRKESNYTQEQLADILGVSRQSISKWESDIAYPETDKLIELGKIFNCSMDYLLKEEVTDKNNSTTSFSDDKIEKICQKVVPTKTRRNIKRILIIIGVLSLVVVIATVITFISIIQKYINMSDEKPSDYYTAECMVVDCNEDTVDNGRYCEKHTCVAEKCTNKKTLGDYCSNHAIQ